MRLDDLNTDIRLTATVKESERITSDEADEIRNLVLEVDDRELGFQAGQSIGVVVPGPHEFGQMEHFRLYTAANTHKAGDGPARLELCVKRCFSIDEISGERHRGVASGYLCDRQPGDQVTITGPYGRAFTVPDERDADLLMIGLGTGIAPFRAFVRHIYEDLGGWDGRVRLFYGAKSGLEAAYMNDRQDDFANYYDEATFKAFAALSPRPHMDDPIPLDAALEEHSADVWESVLKPHTHVYVAGLEAVQEQLDKAFSTMAGSEDKWTRRKAELVAGGRWTELIY